VKCVYKERKKERHYKMKENYTRVVRMEQKHKTNKKRKAVRDKRREEEVKGRN
jgi:hypothetical protein